MKLFRRKGQPPSHDDEALPDSGEALAACGLRRSFGTEVAVDGVSFTIGKGELFGLIGPDGAGKTTTIRMLTGLVRPDAGEARVLGTTVSPGARGVREAVGYMPQQYSLYGDLSID